MSQTNRSTNSKGRNYKKKKRPIRKVEMAERVSYNTIKTDSSNNAKFPSGELATEKYNDVSWYAKNAQMLKDAASFSYNKPLGAKIDQTKFISLANYVYKDGGTAADPHLTAALSTKSVPGIINLVTGIGPGLSKEYTSPINLAAQNIYSFVRYNNSGARNYDPQDLMLYMFALDSAYSCWNFLKRAYGLARSYSQSNWYMPKYLIESQGINFNDLINNLSDFRLYLNTAASRLSSFCVPATMPIFVRHSWIFSNVWADSANNKAQLYQFVPLYFYRYSEVTNPQGGELAAVEWSAWKTYPNSKFSTHMVPTLKTVSECEAYLTNLLDALVYSEDIGVMSGDILKAYGEAKLFKVTPVPEDYTVDPVYNEEVLNQIHNASIIAEEYHNGGAASGGVSVFNITQNPNQNVLLWNPQFACGSVCKAATMLNMPWNDVTPENTMVGSRLACDWQPVPGQTSEVWFVPSAIKGQFTAVGTEFVYMANICFISDQAESTLNQFGRWYGFKTLDLCAIGAAFSPGTISTAQARFIAATSEVTEYLAKIALFTNFDWHPLVMPLLWDLIETSNEVTTITLSAKQWLGDLSNWTIVEDEDLQDLHLTAVMSEFDIPQIGSF